MTNIVKLTMDVHAQHLNLILPQLLNNTKTTDTNSDHVMPVMNNSGLYSSEQMGCDCQAPFSACFYSSANPGIRECLTNAPAPRKRSRGDFCSLNEHLSGQIQQQELEINHFINHHTEKLRRELSERRKRQMRCVAQVVEQAVTTRLRAMEEEMEKMRKLNLALEEQARAVYLENQIWRELARSNEAAANSLRFHLEQVLSDRVQVEKGVNEEAAENAESCCDSSGGIGGGGSDMAEESGERSPRLGVCRACGAREASVLVLPCRHLCVCPTCGSSARKCPVCHSDITATVNVNLC